MWCEHLRCLPIILRSHKGTFRWLLRLLSFHLDQMVTLWIESASDPHRLIWFSVPQTGLDH